MLNCTDHLQSSHHLLSPEYLPHPPPTPREPKSWRAYESPETCSTWSWFSGWPGSTFPQGKASCMWREVLWRASGQFDLVGHASCSSPTPSKHLVYIMYSLYSLRLGCCLQYRNRIGLLTLTDAVNQSLSLRLDAAQRTIRSVMPRIMCFLAVFSTVFALLFPHGKICKNILVAHVF